MKAHQNPLVQAWQSPKGFLTPLFFILLAFTSVGVKDPDLWWHLKTGEFIAMSGRVPRHDIFSWSKEGHEWVAHEWLSELFMYAVYHFAGLAGLVVVFGAITALAYMIASWRCHSSALATALATLLGAVASGTVWGPRPQMFTLLLASVFFFILDSQRRIWVLVPLMILWVNLHAGFAVGLGLIFLYGLGALLEGNKTKAMWMALWFMACFAVVPINPNGVKLFTYPLETLASPAMQTLLRDWAPPDFRSINTLGLVMFLSALFGSLALSQKRPKVGQTLILFVFTYATLRSGRHVPFLALAGIPLLAERLPSNSREANPFLLPASIVLAAAMVWVNATRTPQLGKGPLPQGAVEWMDNNQSSGQLYNWYDWGGYLIWRGYKVYIDGRPDMYGDRHVWEDKAIGDGEGDWQRIFDEGNVQVVMITPTSRLAKQLEGASGWVKRYEDHLSVVFTRQ